MEPDLMEVDDKSSVKEELEEDDGPPKLEQEPVSAVAMATVKYQLLPETAANNSPKRTPQHSKSPRHHPAHHPAEMEKVSDVVSDAVPSPFQSEVSHNDVKVEPKDVVADSPAKAPKMRCRKRLISETNKVVEAVSEQEPLESTKESAQSESADTESEETRSVKKRKATRSLEKAAPPTKVKGKRKIELKSEDVEEAEPAVKKPRQKQPKKKEETEELEEDQIKKEEEKDHPPKPSDVPTSPASKPAPQLTLNVEEEHVEQEAGDYYTPAPPHLSPISGQSHNTPADNVTVSIPSQSSATSDAISADISAAKETSTSVPKKSETVEEPVAGDAASTTDAQAVIDSIITSSINASASSNSFNSDLLARALSPIPTPGNNTTMAVAAALLASLSEPVHLARPMSSTSSSSSSSSSTAEEDNDSSASSALPAEETTTEENTSTKSDQDANMEVEKLMSGSEDIMETAAAAIAGGESPSLCDMSMMSVGSGGSSGNAASSKSDDLTTTVVTAMAVTKKRKSAADVSNNDKEDKESLSSKPKRRRRGHKSASDKRGKRDTLKHGELPQSLLLIRIITARKM